MECNPEGLSVLGYPILSDYNYEQERGQGAGGGELATASPSSGGQRVWSVIQRSEDRGQSAQANAEGKWRLELGARSLIQRGICSRYPITITSRSREQRAGNRGQGVAERI